MATPAAKMTLAAQAATYDNVAIALQGGGALGAYQAGVYAALDEVGILPTRLSGISIGALNAAIIAGNPPERRVAQLRAFWNTISSAAPTDALVEQGAVPDAWRAGLDQLTALRAVAFGQPGFFHPRLFPPLGTGWGTSPDRVSWYDTRPLRDTLERLVDFDRLNDRRAPHVVISAVNVATGNFTRFDNRVQRLRPEHFMASGALPPGLPPIRIDGEYYWDGGIVSNTPLYEVLRDQPGCNTLVFQVDLWSTRGELPRDLADAAERRKEIQYASRTRFFTRLMRERQEQRCAMHELLALVPPAQRNHPAYRQLAAQAESTRTNVIHLIYTNKLPHAHGKDYDFNRANIHRHWQSGLADMRKTLAHPDWLALPTAEHPFVTHDVHRAEAH